MVNKSFYNSWEKKNIGRNKVDYNKNSVYRSSLKYLLPIIIISFIIIVVQWVKIVPEYEIINFNQKNKVYEPDSVIKPKLLLKNKNNKPILIQAKSTKKDIKNSNIFFLDEPNGYYRLSNNITIYFNATEGILHVDKNELKLNENVEISSSEGSNLKTTNINYDIKNSVIIGKENITLIGEWGKLLGTGFTYKIQESLIILNGRPKLTFKNNKGLL